MAGRSWLDDRLSDISDAGEELLAVVVRHPLVGHSAPDFELADATKLGELLRFSDLS